MINDEPIFVVKSMKLDVKTIAARELLKKAYRFTENQLEEFMILSVLRNKQLGGNYIMPDEDSRNKMYDELGSIYQIPLKQIQKDVIKSAIVRKQISQV
jgi:hypothetical protein